MPEPNTAAPDGMVSVRYMVNDVAKAMAFYTTFLGFTVQNHFPPFADVVRGRLRPHRGSAPTPDAG